MCTHSQVRQGVGIPVDAAPAAEAEEQMAEEVRGLPGVERRVSPRRAQRPPTSLLEYPMSRTDRSTLHLPQERPAAGGTPRALGSLLAAALLASACSETRDADNALQGGALTVFDNTTMAYDTPSPVVEANADLFERFVNGDRLYELDRVASPARVPGTGGLGPLYLGRSCTNCHQRTGRTKPTLFTHGGTGYDFSSHLVFLRSRNGAHFPDYGRVLHDHATYGVAPEGRLNVEYEETCSEFPTADRERYCLLRPRYWVSDWYTTPPPAGDVVMSVRTPLRHVGLGPMLA